MAEKEHLAEARLLERVAALEDKLRYEHRERQEAQARAGVANCGNLANCTSMARSDVVSFVRCLNAHGCRSVERKTVHGSLADSRSGLVFFGPRRC